MLLLIDFFVCLDIGYIFMLDLFIAVTQTICSTQVHDAFFQIPEPHLLTHESAVCHCVTLYSIHVVYYYRVTGMYVQIFQFDSHDFRQYQFNLV